MGRSEPAIDCEELGAAEATQDPMTPDTFALWPLLATGLAAAEASDVATLRAVVPASDGPVADVCTPTTASAASRAPSPVRGSRRGGVLPSPHFAPGACETISRRFWPLRPRGASSGPFRHPASATPALVIASTHDPRTPYEWGKRVVRDLGNARLLTFRGDGHGVLVTFDPCALAAFVLYSEEGKLPPPGASCRQDVPFAWAAAMKQAGPHWDVPGGVER